MMLEIHAEKQITMENEFGLNMHFRVYTFIVCTVKVWILCFYSIC